MRLLGSVLLAAAAAAQDGLAILERRCASCHNAARRKADLDLTTREAALRGGSHGPAIVPGDPGNSLLLALVEHRRTPHMPLREAKLGDHEIATLRAWIAAGAVYDRTLEAPEGTTPTSGELTVTDTDRAFWSFAPLRAPEPPAVHHHALVRNDIDRFWLHALEQAGIEPAPEADRRTLLRRLSFTLLGLPPTPEAIESFAADPRADAYERRVAELLASPHFGERQARHWLDVARYADSGGYEFDHERPHAWPYRDFVIEAMNADLPFDEFVRLQVAADELRPDDPLAWRATGFLCAGPTVDNQENEQTRHDEYDDVVSTLGSAFLGLTVGCARCHDHKFDAIPARDYYRLVAAFTNTMRSVEPLLPRAAAEEWRGRTRALDGLIDATRARVQRLEAGGRRRGRRDAVPAEGSAAHKAELAELRAVLADLRARKPPEPPMALVMTERDGPREPSWMLRRGNPAEKDGEVEPGFLQVLTPLAEQARFAGPGGPRAALARWLTDVEHGAGRLVARVIVNRIWQWHFGTGLVATPNDFGLQGERPTHPELLEYLAARLVAGGWRLRPIHELIVTSTVYRLGHATGDADDRLLWRRVPMRVDAESLRDAILHASGCLNAAMFGPAVKPYIHRDAIATGSTHKWPLDVVDGPATWRRSIYVFCRRSVRFPLFEAFDAPDAAASCGRRQPTTTPLQALALLNDRFALDQAARCAGRIAREAGDDDVARVARAFAVVLLRAPDADELRRAVEFLAEQRGRCGGDAHRALADLCQVLLNSNEFLHVD